jgi:hypothetical protein
MLFLAAALAGTAAWGQPPRFQEGGFVVTVQYGPGFWALDGARLAEQVDATDPGGAELFLGGVRDTHTVSLRLAYSILGHASLGAELTATGWNLADPTRGGAGFGVGTLTWHPLQLVFMQKEVRPIPIDLGTWFGVGYGIAGQKRGMDGLIFEWGANLDWFFTRYFALGLFTRGVFFSWDNYFLDYQNRALPGMTIPLPKTSGGAFWTFGVSISLRAGD